MRLLFILMLFVLSCKNEKTMTSVFKDKIIKKDSNLVKFKEMTPRVSHNLEKLDSLSKTEDGHLKKARRIDTPIEIKKLIPQEIYLTYTVDFTGDGVLDFISQVETTRKKDPIRDYWISSNFKIIREQRGYVDVSILGFFNIDDDDELEYIRIDGEDINIDYVICDLKNGKEKELFYFHPIIEYEENYYWGDRYLIKDIVYKKDAGEILFKSSIKHPIVIDDREEIHPDWQKKMPVLLFKGKKKGWYEIEVLKKLQFIKIEVLKNKVLKKNNWQR